MRDGNRKVYCSTGAFTGRINGRNHRLAIDYADQLECDGFEVMIFSDWYDRLDRILSDYMASEINCPVIHADKRMGDWISAPSEDNRNTCLRIWENNCHFGAELKAQKIVCHIWGVPDSDTYMDIISERYGKLEAIAQQYGLDMVAENCFCVNGSPLSHFRELVKQYPQMGITLDTRPAQFHDELLKFTNSSLLISNNIRHIHINDYAGGYKDWDAMYPIPQPGDGNIDFNAFFCSLKQNKYSGSITLEAPSMRSDGVDTDTLNRSLRWIRKQLK